MIVSPYPALSPISLLYLEQKGSVTSWQMIRSDLATTGLEIEENIPANIPFIHANAQEMEQVFLNLFINLN